MRKIIGVLMLLLCSIPFTALAQDGDTELSETFRLETEFGVLSINYPAGWSVEGRESIFPYGAIDNQALIGRELASARVEVAVAAGALLPFVYDRSAENQGAAYLTAYQQARIEAKMGIYGRVVPVTLANGFRAGITTFVESDSTLPLIESTKVSLALVAAVNSETLLIIEMQAAQREDYNALWLAMLDTATWDGVTLIDDEVKTLMGNLDNPAILRRLFHEVYQQQPSIPGPDPTIRYTLTVDDSVVSFVRPQGWFSVEDEQQLTLQNVTMPNATLDFALVEPNDPNTTPQAIPLATLLYGIRERGAEVIDLYSFEWAGYLAAGITYRLDDVVGMQIGVLLPDGLLRLTAESLPSDWITVRSNLFVVGSSLAVNEVKLGLEPLLRSANALRSPA